METKHRDGLLSVVLPAYNEEAMVEKTANVLSALLQKENIPYELVFVNDGSSDSTWEKLSQIVKEYPHVKAVQFSRNFGKEAAVSAGLAMASGDCIAVMDCDLQHPPETLIEMYSNWKDGYKVVEGIKKSRGDESAMHKFSAATFYKIMTGIMDVDLSKASDFKLLDREVVKSILSMPERNSFFRVMSTWVGYPTTTVEFDVQEREAGESKWSTKSLVHYAVNNILEYTAKPMQFVTWAGVITFICAVILGIQTLVRYFQGTAAPGFTTVILLILIMSSIIMFALGIIGQYIAKIYEEVKRRPRYIISDILENNHE